MRAIALEMDRSEHAIWKQASKHKIELRRAMLGVWLTGEVVQLPREPALISLKSQDLKPPRRTLSEKEFDDLESMWRGGIPLYDISVHLKRTTYSVKLMSHRLKLKPSAPE